MKAYVNPEIIIAEFAAENVITSSSVTENKALTEARSIMADNGVRAAQQFEFIF